MNKKIHFCVLLFALALLFHLPTEATHKQSSQALIQAVKEQKDQALIRHLVLVMKLDLDAVDSNGQTAFSHATDLKQADTLDCLIELHKKLLYDYRYMPFGV